LVAAVVGVIVTPTISQLFDLTTLTLKLSLLAAEALLLFVCTIAGAVALRSDQGSTDRPRAGSYCNSGTWVSGLISNDGSKSCAECCSGGRAGCCVVKLQATIAAAS
jgi:hypothetical protein